MCGPDTDSEVLFAEDDDGRGFVQITAAAGEVEKGLVVDGDSVVFEDGRASLDQVDLSLQQLEEVLLVVLQKVMDAAVDGVGLTCLVDDVEHLVVPGVGVKVIFISFAAQTMRIGEEESVIQESVARHGVTAGRADKADGW